MYKRRCFWSGQEIVEPKEGVHDNVILVATTNPSGKHGLGVANTAMRYWGAKYGVGRGLCGRSYLLPTKNLVKDYYEECTGITYRRYGRRSLTKKQIVTNIEEMYRTAEKMSDKKFVVCYKMGSKNLNGYTDEEIVDLFTSNIKVPINIVFHESWKQFFI